MIATKIEIKALLAITSTTQDSLIDRLIPIVEDDIREYTNNSFQDDNVFIQSGDILFTRNSTSADTIDLDGSGDGFVDSLFKDGQTVYVQGSFNNDGFHEVETVTSAAMTMFTTTSRPFFQEMVTEDEGVFVLITKVDYPVALKNSMSQMMKYKLSNYDYSVESETVARYSVTFNTNELINGYPRGLMTALNRWKVVRFV